MEAWQQELKKCQQAAAASEQQARTAWIALADEHYRLARLAACTTPALEQAGLSREAEDFRLMVRRLEHVLHQAGVSSQAPVGVPYTIEMSDALLNLEQQVSQTLQEPTVLEVIEPIVLQHGEMIRPGKAIIAVPAPEGRS
jgi:hypothetical protein